MNLWKRALLALAILPLAAPAAWAQANQYDKPVDLKGLVTPIVPLPPNSKLNPGSVGGYQNPYTTAPLQKPDFTTNDPAPGLKLTIPAR
jgi:hypothetical protein